MERLINNYINMLKTIWSTAAKKSICANEDQDIPESSIEDDSTENITPQVNEKPDKSDYLDELEKLAELTRQGVLTEEEYEDKKKELENLDK